MGIDVLIIGLAAAALCILVYSVFRSREKRLMEKLQNMVDQAALGELKPEQADETMMSALENSMHRFLEDKKLLTDNLEEQKHRIQMLVSDISHQTTTPVSNILLYSQIIEERSDDEDMRRHAETIRTEAEKLDFLIGSLVKISRLEAGIIRTHASIASVKELVEDTAASVRAEAERKNIALHCNTQDDISGKFDEKWTREALLNIADNAVKYTGEGGCVSFRISKYTMFVRIDIADDGIGMEESEINRAFDRFYRSPRVSGCDGVGIGLYLARLIITAQDGYIKVSSEPGKGSVFSVFLPAKSQNCNN